MPETTLLESATAAVDIARKAGANDAWASVSRDRSVSYTYRDGKIEKVEDSTSRGLGISLYVDGRYSTHSTTDLRPDRLKSFVEDAVVLTHALQPDPQRKIPDPSLFKDRPTVDLERSDPAVTKLTREQREAWLAEMDARAHGDPRVISAESNLFSGESRGASASSNGFSGTWDSSYAGFSGSVTVREGEDKRPEGSAHSVGRFVGSLPEPAQDRRARPAPRPRSPRQQEGPDPAHHHGRRPRGRRLADLPRPRPGQRRVDPAGPLVLGRQGRPAAVRRQAHHHRRSADPPRPRLAPLRRRGHLRQAHAHHREGRRPQPLRRHLLRPQARPRPHHGLRVQPRRRPRRQEPRRAARRGRQRHLRHLLARRQQRQHHRRLLARPARPPHRERQDRRARSAR
jgi:hypothetical protein